MNTIKNWYVNEYPTDELGEEIDTELTFEELKNNVPNVYDMMKVYDSLVRERVFTKLASQQDVSYDEIYNQWLNTINEY